MTKKIVKKISDLEHDPNNARLHTDRNKNFIAKSMKEFGANRPVVIDENGVILSGNGVVETARNLGLDEIEVIEVDGNELVAVQVDHLDEEKKRQYAIADNRAGELSEWDTDVLAETIRKGADVSNMFFEDELTDMMGTDWWPEERVALFGRVKEKVEREEKQREVHMLTYMCPHCYHEWTERKV